MGNYVTSINGEVHKDMETPYQAEEHDVFYDTFSEDDLLDRVTVGQRLRHSRSQLMPPTPPPPPPHVGAHRAPHTSADYHQTQSPHRSNHAMTTVCEGDDMTISPRKGGRIDDDDVRYTSRYTHQNTSTSQPGNTDTCITDWEQDAKDPFEKVMANKDAHKTVIITEEKALEQDILPVLQSIKKLQASGNGQPLEIKQQYRHFEEQNSITKQHLDDGKQYHKTQQQQQQQQQGRTLQHNSNPYSVEEHDHNTKQYSDGEGEGRRPWHRYKYVQQNSRISRLCDSENEDDDTTPQYYSSDHEEQDSRPWNHYTYIEQDSRSQDDHLKARVSDSKPWHRYEYTNQSMKTVQRCESEEEDQDSTSNQCSNDDDDEKQDSRPLQHYKDEHYDSKAQHLHNVEQQDFRPLQHCKDEYFESKAQHLHNVEQQDPRPLQHCRDELYDSKAQHHNVEQQDSRPWQHCKDENYESKAQHLYNVEQHGTRNQLYHFHKDQVHDAKRTRSQQYGEGDDSDEDEAGPSHHHIPEREPSKMPNCVKEAKRSWDGGRGKDHESVRNGEQQTQTRQPDDQPDSQHTHSWKNNKADVQYEEQTQTRQPDDQPGSQHTHSWKNNKADVQYEEQTQTRQPDDQPGLQHTHSWRKNKADVQYEEPLSWRHNSRTTYNYHPQYSGGHWYQKQQQHNSTYYSRGNNHDALNTVNANLHNDKGDILELDHLVNALGERPKFYSTFQNLSHYQSLLAESVQRVATAHPHIFHMSKDGVQLQPQIKLCQSHVSRQGCAIALSCPNLHICNTYISNWCSELPCKLGHSLYTQHNRAVLKVFGLESLSVTSLKKLLRHLMFSEAPPLACLDVCQDYNRGSCDKSDCQALHLCLNFVITRGRCDRSHCLLNHNPVDDKTCCLILNTHGISTNETIMDIIMAILNANPNLIPADSNKSVSPLQSLPNTKTTIEDAGPRKQTTLLDKVKQKFGLNSDSTKKEESYESYSERRRSTSQSSLLRNTSGRKSERNKKSSDTKSDEDEGSNQASKKRDTYRPDEKNTSDHSTSGGAKGGSQTVWSFHRRGDVDTAEICRFSVEGTCMKEDQGCKRLHASLPFHWQIREKRVRNSWINLPGKLVTTLELAFCDPDKNGIKLPPLDSSQLKHVKELFNQDSWYGNFEAMIMTNSDYSKVLELRRLCIQTGASPKHAKSSTFSWFFCDVRGRWVKYGQADTTGQASQKSNITSADIETHYLARPHLPLVFKVSQFTYLLNFSAMTQTNQTTKVKRAVRRRPEPHSTLHLTHAQKH